MRNLAWVMAAWPLLSLPLAAHPATPGEGGAAAAERAEARGATELDRVLVTARRRAEDAKDVPQSLTVADGAELESRGASDISDMAMLTPNATLYPARAFNSSVTAYIRGVGQFDPIWGMEPGVAVYIDDVALARPQGALLDVLDVERVEVLRGPQGTLYGRNSTGGAIKVVTRAPGPEFGGKAVLTLGDYARRDAKLVLNVPLSETLRMRLAAAGYDRDGYGRNLYTSARTGGRDAAVARFNATWTPAGAVEVRFAWDRTRDRSGPRPARRLAIPDPRVDPDRIPPDPGRYDVRSEAPEKLALDNEGASVTVDWDVRPDWRLRSISAWRRGDSQAVMDMESLSRPYWVLYRDFAERQRSQEFQLHHDGGRSRLVAGLYLFDGTEAGDGRSTTIPQSGNQAPLFNRPTGRIRTRSAALYADWLRGLGGTWELDLGMRYTVERKRATAFNAFYTDGSYTVVRMVNADFTDTADFREPTPRVALSWRPSADTLLYAQASRGFKAGSYNVRANAAAYPESVHPVDSETVVAYEAGAKYASPDGRVQASLALFHNDYRDIQLSVFVPEDDGVGVFPDFRNAGDGVTRGIELEWQLRATDRLRWSGHVGYLDAHYTRYMDGGVDISGSRRFPNAPRWTAGTSLVAESPLRGAGRLRARVDGRYQGGTWPTTDAEPLLRQGGYALWNASLAWTPPRPGWELALRVDNLTDTWYRTTGFAYQTGVVTGYYGPPRTWALTVTRGF